MDFKGKISKKSGITLISLVVTIVVMLILAGVSISVLIGKNGILSQVAKAKEETEKAQEKEGVGLAVTASRIGNNGYEELNQNNLQNAIDSQFGTGKATVRDNGDGTFIVSFIDSKRDYNITPNGVENGIDWNKSMANAVAPESQDEERNNGVIGIGTDGKPVDMDLWEYTLYDGSYVLNDIGNIDGTEKTKGYLGEIVNGEIQGKVPQYIKASTDKEFIEVTSLQETFINLSNDFDELTTMPIIPTTVTNMQNTFSRCYNLEKLTNLNSNIENMKYTFYECTSLTNFNLTLSDKLTTMYGTFMKCSNLKNFNSQIPNSVTVLHGTFDECFNLENFSSSIPNNVTDMYACFSQCSNLTYLNIIVPESVNDLRYTFSACPKLSGVIEINANVTGQFIGTQLDYHSCLGYNTASLNNAKIILKGSSNLLEEILSTKTENSNIVIEK